MVPFSYTSPSEPRILLSSSLQLENLKIEEQIGYTDKIKRNVGDSEGAK
jgi:hypothetical protein